jgi:hypothetical protein
LNTRGTTESGNKTKQQRATVSLKPARTTDKPPARTGLRSQSKPKSGNQNREQRAADSQKPVRTATDKPTDKPPVSPVSTHLQSRGTKRKLLPNRKTVTDADEELSEPPFTSKRRRVPRGPYELTEENMSLLEKGTGGDAAPSLKRGPSSRRSVTASEAETTRSQRSSNATSTYRHKNLAAFGIQLHAEPPDYIQAAVDRIMNQEISEERRAEIHVISKKFTNGCFEHAEALSGEDDFLDPLHTAIKALDIKDLCIHQQADWREDLKPVAASRDSKFSSSFIAAVEQRDTDDVTTSPPRKRQQQYGTAFISPDPSSTITRATQPVNQQGFSTMPPPIASRGKKEEQSSIKTPRPDISMGIKLRALILALSSSKSNHLSIDDAEDFFKWMQDDVMLDDADGQSESMLISIPAPRALNLAFPFAVVEGKAYTTGKQISEAENQAVVAAACALKIQVDLNDLVKHARVRSGISLQPKEIKPALFFFICTQGPIHELWASCTVIEGKVRKFQSKLVYSCNALVRVLGEEFLRKLNNVGLWGTGSFKESVVERLGIIAKLSKLS